MPSLTLKNVNIEFSYLDSGVPQSRIYTTIVLVHGHTFHNGVFQRLLPLAPSRRVRIIAVNRRDYAGSTVFSPTELSQLNSESESERALFLQARGKEMALFVATLIEILHLPEPSEDGTNGGIALVGWSLGNMLPVLIMNVGALLPVKVKILLQHYIRRTILYDAPYLAFGFQTPSPYQYNPLFDNAIPEADRGQAFANWVSSYFLHEDLASHSNNKLVYKTPDIRRKSTVSRMTQRELFSAVDMEAAQRTETAFITTMQSTLFQQTRAALFDGSTYTTWPNIKIWVVYGDSSPWMIPYAAWEIERMDTLCNQKQTVNFHVLKDANHFLFWEEPPRTLDAFMHCLEN